ncbi:MAG: lysylphosphatidylglycerol synthase transmembrane domain-containing protein [Bacteroidota bacterium]
MNQPVKIAISIAIAAVLMWFAFKEVDLQNVLNAAKGMSFGWIAPFFGLTLFAHYLRAERWRMLFAGAPVIPARFTLFTGVMFGYLSNIPVPRLGEITRPVYVARQIKESNSKLIGTIVLERVIDLASLLILMTFVGFFVISDADILNRLFGIDFSDQETITSIIKGLVFFGFAVFLMAAAAWFTLPMLLKWSPVQSFLERVKGIAIPFVQGILSIRQLKNWPLFVMHTLLIWVAYVIMTYIPFWMFDLHTEFDLSIIDALVLTMVSAVGISIPTPGGVGSYHLFVTKALLILYAVPEEIGLAYATIAHAASLVVIVLSTPVFLSIEKYLNLGREAAALEPEARS